MAKTPAEYQKAYRQRLKDKKKAAPDQTDFVTTPLSEYLEDIDLPFVEGLDSLGVHIDGNLGGDLQTFRSFRSDGLGQVEMTGLERLTALADTFLEAAIELHTIVNHYKQQEVRDRLAELSGPDLADPQARRDAMQRAVHLNAVLKALSKRSRHDFPVIVVKEVPS